MSDEQYIARYRPKRLYVNPSPKGGAYAAICDDHEENVLGEFELSNLTRISVSAFYKKDSSNISTLKIHKLRFRKNSGWFLDESISFNGFDTEVVTSLLSILRSLDLENPSKKKIDLNTFSLDDLLSFASFENIQKITRDLSKNPKFSNDIFALANKRKSLNDFKKLLENDTPETTWQNFLEANSWIFGLGLNYIFIDKVGEKFEQTTTGSDFNSAGKRADGLAKTRAEVSNFVLIEIKSSTTSLVKRAPYRSGVWQPSDELSGAISQAQKTSFEFSRRQLRTQLKDKDGNNLPEYVYQVFPKSYLVAGRLSQIAQNDDKISCFELLRRNTTSPEIITFDELYHRAEAMLKALETNHHPSV